jgi:hypothetical protein
MWGCLTEENAHMSLSCNMMCECLVEFVQCVWWQGWSMLAALGGVWCLWLVSDGTCGLSELWQKFERDTTYLRHVLSRRSSGLWLGAVRSSGLWLGAVWFFSVLGTHLPTTHRSSSIYHLFTYLLTYLPEHTVARLRNAIWAVVRMSVALPLFNMQIFWTTPTCS